MPVPTHARTPLLDRLGGSQEPLESRPVWLRNLDAKDFTGRNSHG